MQQLQSSTPDSFTSLQASTAQSVLEKLYVSALFSYKVLFKKEKQQQQHLSARQLFPHGEYQRVRGLKSKIKNRFVLQLTWLTLFYCNLKK